jgi:Ni,Fe-hydrogenase I cytochrome b subunit
MPRHSLVVRLTHWINAIASFALIVSGVAILLAHPRLYWGETGAVGAASLIDLPIPFIFGHSGWGRYLHFLAAWVGGQQSARTMHFFAAAAIVAFLIVHVAMLAATGFTARMRSMIVGDAGSAAERR